MYELGIDLGTTFTAAAVWRGDHAEIFPLGTHSAVIPSVALLRQDGELLVGEAAARRAMTEPSRVAREFKRRFGDSAPIMLATSPFSAEALTARLLASVIADVTAREGAPPRAVCLTHPANWGPYKTGLLRDATRLADLSVPVVYTTEPQAAAINHVQSERVAVGEIIAVYDLGGGTFDTAILRRTADGFEMLGHPEGIERLGGMDIDAAVYEHVASVLGRQLADLYEEDPAAISAVARLRQECTAAKEALSADVDVSIPVLLPSVTTEVRLIRAEFEAMVRPPLYASIEAMRRALRSARVTPDDLAAVLLVGGSSRIPMIAQMVGAELGRPVTVDAHPKYAVALGAAVVAHQAAAGSASAAETPRPAPAEPAATEPAPAEPAPTQPAPAPPTVATPTPVPPPQLAPPPVPLPDWSRSPVPPSPGDAPVTPPPGDAAVPPPEPAPVAAIVSSEPGPSESATPAAQKRRLPRALLVVPLIAVLGLGGWGLQSTLGGAEGEATPTAPAAAVAPKELVIATDLPLQGANAETSEETNRLIELYLDSIGHKAGPHTVKLATYDNSTAAAGRWDSKQCEQNAGKHVQATAEVAVVGPYNSGCAKVMAPILNQAPDGPMLLVSHAATNPGLTKWWGEVGEPNSYFPTGKRSFARVIPSDETQARASVDQAFYLGSKRVYVLHDGDSYGKGLADEFVRYGKQAGLTVLGSEAWNPLATSYRDQFAKIKKAGADAVYLAGVFDNNGAQLVKDKVAVLGPNSGVKLLAPDGFTGYPEFTTLPEAEGAYLTFPGVTVGNLRPAGGAAGKLLAAYRAKYGKEPSYSSSFYGVAAAQVIVEAVKVSDGTRAGVVQAVFTRGVTVPADSCALYEDLAIDWQTGDTRLIQTTVEVVKGGQEVYARLLTE